MNLYNKIMNNNEFEQLWKIFDRARYFGFRFLISRVNFNQNEFHSKNDLTNYVFKTGTPLKQQTYNTNLQKAK